MACDTIVVFNAKMFDGDLSTWDTSSATSMDSMVRTTVLSAVEVLFIDHTQSNKNWRFSQNTLVVFWCDSFRFRCWNVERNQSRGLHIHGMYFCSSKPYVPATFANIFFIGILLNSFLNAKALIVTWPTGTLVMLCICHTCFQVSTSPFKQKTPA